MQQLKKIYNTIFRPAKLALLDYAIQPTPLYNHEQPHTLLLQQIAVNKSAYKQLLGEVWGSFWLRVRC